MQNKTEFKIGIYFVGKVFSAIISLSIIPFYVSWFGEENYGLYILTYVTFLIFISASIGWINQSTIKFYSAFLNDKDFHSKVYNLVFKVAIISSIPLLILTKINLKNDSSILLLIIIFLAYILACLYTSKLIEKQAELKPLDFTIAEVIRLLIFFVSTYILRHLIFFTVLELIFLALFLSYLFGYLFLNRFEKPHKIKLNAKIDKELTINFLNYGIPLSVWMVFSPSANGVDRYILNSCLGTVALAQYTVVYDVVFKVFTQLVNPINSVFQPLLMNISNSGNKRLFNKTLIRGILYLVFICLPVLFFFCFFQDYILINYLGFQDTETIKLLKKIIIPLAISAIIWQVGIILQKTLEAEKKTKLMAFYMIIVVFISSIMSIWLLPKYDFSILAYINLGSSVLYLVLIFFSCRYVKH